MPARKRRTWEGRVYLGRDANGQQTFHWVGRFDTKRERDHAVAVAKIERPWERDAAHDEPTVSEWIDRFLSRMESGALKTRQGRRYKSSSIQTARTQLKALDREFGDRIPRSITRMEAEDFAAKVSPSMLPMVVQFMNYLMRRAEVIERNRFEGLGHRLEGNGKDRRPPSEDEMLTLSAACNALGDYAPMMRALFTFAAYTLMRPGELIALNWDDLDPEAKRGMVQRRWYRGTLDIPKSNKTRKISLPEPALVALEQLRRIDGYEPFGLVFRNKTGGALTPPTLTAYWKEVRARACLDHDFYAATKHYGCWYMKVKLGLPDAVIAAQAGWAESTVTAMVKRYAHAVDERRLIEIDQAFAAVEQVA